MRTVKELIEVLSTFPEDLPVFVHGTESSIIEAENFTVDFRPDYNGTAYLVLEGARYNDNPKDMSGKDITWEP